MTNQSSTPAPTGNGSVGETSTPQPQGAQQATPGSGSAYPGMPYGGMMFPPPAGHPKITTMYWEDENTVCYQVEVNGVTVSRREDTNFINGTKLLNVAKMTRGRRDGILKAEKVRYVVKIGAMHLKGVWIPFDRAYDLAVREGIANDLQLLFAPDIKSLLNTQQPVPPVGWHPAMGFGLPPPMPGFETGTPGAPGSGSTDPNINPNLTKDSKTSDSSGPGSSSSNAAYTGFYNPYRAPYYSYYPYGYMMPPPPGGAATTPGGHPSSGGNNQQPYQMPPMPYGYMPSPYGMPPPQVGQTPGGPATPSPAAVNATASSSAAATTPSGTGASSSYAGQTYPVQSGGLWPTGPSDGTGQEGDKSDKTEDAEDAIFDGEDGAFGRRKPRKN